MDISDILPKDKRPRSNKTAILSVNRRSLPLVPAYSITTHKSQGQTLSKVVIDLKLPSETDDIAAVYVPLSRVKHLADLVLVRYFDYKVLLIKPSKSQVAQVEDLKNCIQRLTFVAMTGFDVFSRLYKVVLSDVD